MSKNPGMSIHQNASTAVIDRSPTSNVKKVSSSDKTRPQKHDLHLSDSSISVRTVHTNRRLIPSQTRTPVKYNGLHRSCSTASLLERDVRAKFGGEDNEKQNVVKYVSSSTKVNSGDKTPVTHLYTPRRSGDQPGSRQTLLSGGCNRKQATSHTKPTLKHSCSEINLAKPPATPDCFNKVQMETPRSRVEPGDFSGLDVEASNLTVGVRVRPLNYREQSDFAVTNIINVDSNEVKVMYDSGTSHNFTYDHCFWSCDPQHPQFASQDVVFTAMVQPLVDKAFQGYNACLFAYGQTGSGKSYSMMGLDVDTLDTRSKFGKEAGIIPRFCYEVFERIGSLEDSKVVKPSGSRITVEISYFEIYNEKIHDLLGGSCESGRRAPLKVREHPIFGPYVVDLSTHGVVSYEDLQGWLKVGNSQRATAATGMNEKSSRSHSIFSVILTQTQDEIVMEEHHEHSRRSKINLVDLAGSERLSHTCASGDRLREGVSINRSLLTLGKVIASLAENTSSKKRGFVPYRDSVLTWLLRESLGGNSRTTMLATISPASIHVDETLATLRYACQARTIINRVCVNEDPRDRLIRELSAEVENLLALRADQERQLKKGAPRRLIGISESSSSNKQSEIRHKELEISRLRDQLRRSEDLLTNSQKSWSERLQEAERCKSAELQFLKRCGVAVQLNLEQQHPYLVNLNPDPILSGTLLYLLPPGTVQVGRHVPEPTEHQPDISLNGPLVYRDHCCIKNENGKLSLIPGKVGQTFVNGKVVTNAVTLHHGDRVVIGGSHYFGLNNPLDHTAKMSSGNPVDYQFAYQEIHKVQENKLRAELEEAKKRALKELEEAHQEAERQLGSQRSLYEDQLQQLTNILEQHKDALSEVSQKKEELEVQKCTLEAEVQRHKEWSLFQLEESFVISPPKSNFLQEIEEILNATSTETGNISLTNVMDPSISDVNLHEMQVMVQEATQRCKELGMNYEFSQQHIVGECGLEPAVRVRSRDKCLATSWKPLHFLHWLNQLRHHDPDESLKELLDIDEETWEDDENDSETEESHMSVSTKHIKRQLNESIHQLSIDTSSCNDSELETSYSNGLDVIDNGPQDSNADEMNSYMQQIEEAVNNLRMICSEDKVQDTLNTLDKIVVHLRTTLNLSNMSCRSDSQHLHVTQDISHTNSNYLITQLIVPTPPSKSNLRSPCPNGLNKLKTQKAVRFFFTDSQEEKHSEN